MKLKLLTINKIPTLQLTYEGEEWEIIESKLKSLDLSKAETMQAWGSARVLPYPL